jgi:general secretion pathway protein C
LGAKRIIVEMTANIWSSSGGAGSDWRSAAVARAPQAVTVILALALAAQLAFAVVGLTSRSRQVTPAVRTAPPAPPLDLGGLVNAHLFGNAAVQNTGDASNAPPSTMPLILAGVLATNDPKVGMAIIGESAAAAKVVSVGKQVPGGATLHSVYSDRVIIDRNGALESVLLPRRSAGGMASPLPPPVAANANGNEAVLERMRKLVNDDPGLIGQIMRPQPLFAQGKMQGFRVYPGANRQAFARLGLRAGDTITAINGTPLDDQGRAKEIMDTLGTAADARITIRRGDRTQELVLNLAQIASEAEQAGAAGNGMIPMDQAPVEAPTGNE